MQAEIVGVLNKFVLSSGSQKSLICKIIKIADLFIIIKYTHW